MSRMLQSARLQRVGSSISAVIVAFVLTRLLLLGFLTGNVLYPEGPSVINDVLLYSEWSELLVTGRFPIGDDMWQYPPGAGAVFALAALIGGSAVQGFFVIALACDAAILGALIAVAYRRSRAAHAQLTPNSLVAAWSWVAAALIIGPVFIARFDVIPTAAAVASLLLISRPVYSGAMAAIGTLLKVWPGLMMLAIPRRSLICGSTGFVVTAVGIVMMVSVWAVGGVAFVGEQQARGLQVESVGAWPFMVAQAFGADIPLEFRFGAMEIDLGITVTIGSIITFAGLGVIGFLGIARLLGSLEQIPGIDIAMAALLVSIVTSRVLSPQYMVWVAGVACVALLDRHTRLRPVIVLLVVSTLVGQIIYPLGYGSLLNGDWWAVALQSIRIMTLLAATGWTLWLVVRGLTGPELRRRKHQQSVKPVATGSDESRTAHSAIEAAPPQRD